MYYSRVLFSISWHFFKEINCPLVIAIFKIDGYHLSIFFAEMSRVKYVMSQPFYLLTYLLTYSLTHSLTFMIGGCLTVGDSSFTLLDVFMISLLLFFSVFLLLFAGFPLSYLVIDCDCIFFVLTLNIFE